MKAHSFGLTALLAVGIGAPALAADIPMTAPAYKAAPVAAPVYDWTGFYVGGHVGVGWNRLGATFTPLDDFFASVGNPVPFAPVSSTIPGVVAGLHAGFNWQLGQRWVAGFEADFDYSGIDGQSASTNAVGFAGVFTATANRHVQWFGTVRGRLGYLPTDNLLIYATGGFAYASVVESVAIASPSGTSFIGFGTPLRDLNCGFPPVTAGSTCMAGGASRTATGWAAGLGAEVRLAQNLLMRAEYLHVGLGGSSFTVITVTPPIIAGRPGPSLRADLNSASFSVVRFGLTYKFGGPIAARN